MGTGGADGAGDGSGAATMGNGSADGSGDGADGGSGPKLDVGSGNTGGTDPDAQTPCQQVDILFVIDNSSSMRGEQDELVASFPGFIAGIQSTLETVESYHVGVVTTDYYEGNNFNCQTIGDLVTSTTGQYSSNSTCGPYADGKNYMTQSDDLDSAFSCAAKVGVDGSLAEKPMEAMLRAVSPGNQAPGACNDGFIRDDSLLVVVTITDEEDDEGGNFPGSAGTPDDWFNQLTAYKGGIEENIVVLSLVGVPEPNLCFSDTAETATRVLEFTDKFTHGFVGDVCTPNYGDYFQEAVDVIETACNEYTPVG